MANRSRSGLRSQRSVQALQKLLRLGLTVVSELWSHPTGDWVSSVHAADIDGDGDIEVLLGSRDNNIYALTRRGILKWKFRTDGEWIRTLRGINNAEATDNTRIITGSRDGKVQAFDENGELRWEYQTGHVVRKIRIHDIDQDGKIEVLVGSEDQCTYALSSETGELLWKYPTGGWIYTLYVADVDNDNKPEILVCSGDKRLSILDGWGKLKWRYDTTSEIHSIFATDIDGDGQVEILVATDTKELFAHTIKGQEKWRFNADNRILSLVVADINKDGHLEVIAASEDKHLYVLDHQGELLWKHNLNSRVFSVFATDIDNDGLIEVIAGTEDSIHVLRIELMVGLREKIVASYRMLRHLPPAKLKLSATETTLLQDLTSEWSLDLNEQNITLESARESMKKGDYLQALATLVVLDQQKVQLLWSKKVGRVRAVFSGDLNNDGDLELVAGTDDGGIYVISATGKDLWSHESKDGIWTVYIGDIDLDGTLELVAGSGSGWVYVFSNSGEMKWQTKLDQRVESVYINAKEHSPRAEMAIGLRGDRGRIQLYDDHFTPIIQPISTPHGVRIVGMHDLNDDGIAEIIAGGDDDHVYTYKRDGSLLWSYRTGDRARGLVIDDVDGDGRMEIVVGSEDRNVHVLDSAGYLKWRYYTPHRVLSVNTLDLDQDGEVEVFLGTDDGNVLFLSKTGDLLWKYKVGDQVCGVQAADCNQDGKIEILVGSEDSRLYLLQVLDQQEVTYTMEQCWEALQREESSKELIYELARNPASSLRSFALTKIIAQPTLQERDITILHELVRDTSGDVRANFASEIARLYSGNAQLSRRFMDILLADQERDVRLTLVNCLPAIAHIDANISFQYLERFTRSVDAWVRRSVVRTLDQLATSFPQQVFRLLLSLIHDENEWIRQETARTLAHYFDVHENNLIGETRLFIMQHVDPFLLRFIAYSSKKATTGGIFLVFVDLLEQLDETTILEKLEKAVRAFEKTSHLKHGWEMWQLYYELHRLHRMKTIEEIAHYKHEVYPDTAKEIGHFAVMLQVLQKLTGIATILAIYLKRERLGDRLASLLEAVSAIETIHNDLDDRRLEGNVQKSRFPERLIVEVLLINWRNLVMTELSLLRGKANLRPELRTKIVHTEEQVGISLDIRNVGHSPADDVRVTLMPNSDFEVIGEPVSRFETVSALDKVEAEFTIKPYASTLHLTFELVYSDAESKGKMQPFADRMEIRKMAHEFQRIPNPYSTGTPIQTSDMFYGREKDLTMLKEDLTSISANMVVVLHGQRRSGKSSLLYQLLNTSSLDPHIPVYIDMQHETLNMSTGRFLHHLAVAIYRNLKTRDLAIAQPAAKDFDEDPTLAFDLFLDAIEQARKPQKMIIMIDEFEILEQKITEKVLAKEFFEYLRSLMQHRRGINFLLSGTHTIEQLTKEYWSVFFNIARHHRLSMLHAEAARQLITQPVKGYLDYDPLAVEKIRQLAADQPYFLQLICRSLVTHCNESHKSYVTINDVNVVLDRVLETGQIHFKWLWGKSSVEERLALSIIAQEGGDEGRSLSLKDIEEVYRTYGLPYKHEATLRALETLVEEDIITSALEGTRFKIPIGLIRQWLREVKPFRRVLLEENPLTQ